MCKSYEDREILMLEGYTGRVNLVVETALSKFKATVLETLATRTSNDPHGIPPFPTGMPVSSAGDGRGTTPAMDRAVSIDGTRCPHTSSEVTNIFNIVCSEVASLRDDSVLFNTAERTFEKDIEPSICGFGPCDQHEGDVDNPPTTDMEETIDAGAIRVTAGVVVGDEVVIDAKGHPSMVAEVKVIEGDFNLYNLGRSDSYRRFSSTYPM